MAGTSPGPSGRRSGTAAEPSLASAHAPESGRVSVIWCPRMRRSSCQPPGGDGMSARATMRRPPGPARAASATQPGPSSRSTAAKNEVSRA